MYVYMLADRHSNAPPLRAREYFAFFSLAFLAVTVFFFVFGTCSAFAQDGPPPDATRLVLPQTQFLAALVGAIVPLVTYVLNKHAPWQSEEIKGPVLAVAAAVAGALTTLLDTGGIPLTWDTAQVVGMAVVGALLAHSQFYTRAGWSTRLGGGQKVQHE